MRTPNPANPRNPKTPWDFIEKQRRELLQLDDDALASLQSAYASSTQGAFRQLQKVMRQIERALERGEPIHPNWLWRQERWTSLLLQMGAEMNLFGARAADTVDRLGVTSAQMGLDHSGVRMKAVGPEISFDQLPREALDMMVANLRSRAPAGALLRNIASDAQRAMQTAMYDAMGRELITGVALGRNPRDVARRMHSQVKDELDSMSYRRAELIARTESMRMYRGSQLENYRNNDDVVEGWIWVASLDIFTCPACLARHLSQHPLSEELQSHPACRCTAMPFVDDEKPDLPFGDEWLRSLPESDQLQVMRSPERLEMWRDGVVSLADLATVKIHPQWGRSVNVTPLKKLRRIKSGELESAPNVIWNPRNDPISIAPPKPPTPTPPTIPPAPSPPVETQVPIRRAPSIKPEPKISLRATSNFKGGETLDEFEAIARKQSGRRGYETAAAFDKNGNMLFIRDGDDSSVSFDSVEWAMMKDAVTSHNHPFGSSFSEADVASFIRAGGLEMRAVGEQFTYRLYGSVHEGLMQHGADAIARVAAEHLTKEKRALNRIYEALVVSGKMDANDAWLEQTHRAMETIAKRFGLTYERIPVK